MLFSPVLIVMFVYLHEGCCKQCPKVYSTLDRNHSFCKPRNPQCTIFASGIHLKEIEEILSVHNEYRSKVAVGRETRAGGLPAAADMMQMVWDDELAAIAQHWAEQCKYGHDCNTCRAVPNYKVGQNIAAEKWSCPSEGCQLVGDRHPRNWTETINHFLGEIKVFNKNLVNSIQFDDSKIYGHLTQIMWAKTWRIGCGYVAHLHEGWYKHFYVCNYGPGGNLRRQPVYTAGNPCSRCPSSTCCGESCKDGKVYPGLCRILDDKSSRNNGGNRRNATIFYSDFGRDSPSDVCLKGVYNWKITRYSSGNILSTVLKSGEYSIWGFNQAIVPSEAFCLSIKYRKGPIEWGQKNSNRLVMVFKPEGMSHVQKSVNHNSSETFKTVDLDLDWKAKTKFSIVFSVPPASPLQFLDVQSILARNGKCSTYEST